MSWGGLFDQYYEKNTRNQSELYEKKHLSLMFCLHQCKTNWIFDLASTKGILQSMCLFSTLEFHLFSWNNLIVSNMRAGGTRESWYPKAWIN